MNVEREMEKFLRREIFMAREGELTRFVLRHAGEGKKGDEVDSFPIKDNFTQDDLSLFRDEILTRAQSDADGCGGVNRYVLQTFVKGETSSPARFVFKLKGDDEDEMNSLSGEEGATQAGLLKQLMRHNDALSRTLVQNSIGISATLVRRLESSDRQVEKLIAQRHEDLELVEQLYTRKHERELELYQAEASEKRKGEMMEKLHLIMPAVVNKLVGGKILPGDSPMALMLKELIQSLNPQQFAQMQQILSPDQSIVLIQMIQAYQAEEEAKGKAKELKKGDGQ